MSNYRQSQALKFVLRAGSSFNSHLTVGLPMPSPVRGDQAACAHAMIAPKTKLAARHCGAGNEHHAEKLCLPGNGTYDASERKNWTPGMRIFCNKGPR